MVWTPKQCYKEVVMYMEGLSISHRSRYSLEAFVEVLLISTPHHMFPWRDKKNIHWANLFSTAT